MLTGLFNRRSFTASFAERFDEPQKLRTACLIMWDLDNLKYINDTYGHDWGDRYIQCLAECLKNSMNTARWSRVSPATNSMSS